MTRKQLILALTIIVAISFGQRFSGAAVPFTPAGDGHDTIPAFVNGRGPFAFILDTGADGSALYQWFAAKEHLPKGKVRDLYGQTGSVSSPTYSLKTLSVDGRAIHNVVADGLPNRHDAGQQAGVAGNDLMDGTITIFDFPCAEKTPPFILESHTIAVWPATHRVLTIIPFERAIGLCRRPCGWRNRNQSQCGGDTMNTKSKWVVALTGPAARTRR